MRSREKKNNSELQETKTGEWRVLKRSCTCPTNCGSESLRFCLRCGQEIRIVIKETFASPHKKPLTAKNLFRLPDFRLSVCTKVATVPVCNRSRYYTSNNFFFFFKWAFGESKTTNQGHCVCAINLLLTKAQCHSSSWRGVRIYSLKHGLSTVTNSIQTKCSSLRLSKMPQPVYLAPSYVV